MTRVHAAFPGSFEAFIEEIKRREDVFGFEKHFKETLEVAASDPRALYRFFQLYNYLNAQIASCIAGLVGNIGMSREAFIDPSIPVRDEADYSFEIADWMLKAAIDEYEDPKLSDVYTGRGVSHRILASGLKKSIGNYAGLSDEERDVFTIPDWLRELTQQIQCLYVGEKDNPQALAKAVGAHIFSEFSADAIEFSNSCKALFVDRRS